MNKFIKYWAELISESTVEDKSTLVEKRKYDDYDVFDDIDDFDDDAVDYDDLEHRDGFRVIDPDKPGEEDFVDKEFNDPDDEINKFLKFHDKEARNVDLEDSTGIDFKETFIDSKIVSGSSLNIFKGHSSDKIKDSIGSMNCFSKLDNALWPEVKDNELYINSLTNYRANGCLCGFYFKLNEDPSSLYWIVFQPKDQKQHKKWPAWYIWKTNSVSDIREILFQDINFYGANKVIDKDTLLKTTGFDFDEFILTSYFKKVVTAFYNQYNSMKSEIPNARAVSVIDRNLPLMLQDKVENRGTYSVINKRLKKN